jgi:hypothetical protein
MIDDKLRILDSMKKTWERLTTVFPRRATTPPIQILAQYPHGDFQLANIGDPVKYELADLVQR